MSGGGCWCYVHDYWKLALDKILLMNYNKQFLFLGRFGMRCFSYSRNIQCINVQYLNFVSFSLQIIFIVSGIIWKSNVGLQLCSNYRIVVGHGSGLCFTITNKIFTQLQSQILRKHSAEGFFPLFFSQIAFLAWNSNFSTDFISFDQTGSRDQG